MKTLSPISSLRCLSIGTVAVVSALFATPAVSATKADEARPKLGIKVLAEPVYPFDLRSRGVTEGFVEMVVVIDGSGSLRDFITIQASHKSFAQAVESVIGRWEFTPPAVIVKGRQINFAHKIRIDFNTKGTMLITTAGGFIAGNMEFMTNVYLNDKFGDISNSIQLMSVADLDSIPEPVHVEMPKFPSEAIKDSSPRSAVFEFYIDQTGKVHIPTFREDGDEIDERVLLAVQNALWNWRFNPPTVNGQPVVVRAAQPFVLNPGPKTDSNP